jgi:opacity protein-like surface antigen
VIVACSLASSHARADKSELDPSLGYNYGEIETARTAATGGAQRALSSSLGALFVNPANIAVERVYHIGAFAQIWPEARRQSYGAGAIDSIGSSSRVAGAAGVTYNFQDPDGIDRKWTDARFALAYPFSEKFYFGVGGRYLLLSQDGLGPLGVSYASGGIADQQIVRTFSFDAGATFKPTPELAFAVTGSNLANPGHGFLPTSVGGGLGYGAKQFGVQADVVGDFTSWDETKVRFMAGLEALLADHYALRGGYRYDQGARSHGLGVGVGYIDRAFIFDIGLRRVVKGDAATTVVLGFTYHLETTGLTPSAGDTF